MISFKPTSPECFPAHIQPYRYDQQTAMRYHEFADNHDKIKLT